MFNGAQKLIKNEVFETCVARAGLAPTVHNTQPARWKLDGDVISLFCDTNVGLVVGDPTGRDAALSCGAVLEGMSLALSCYGVAFQASYSGNDVSPGQGLIAVAHLHLEDGPEDPLQALLEQRFTWRGAFKDEPPSLFGWTRPDARMVLDQNSKDWVAQQNDWASHQIMQDIGFRRELVSWMRLRDGHPRLGLDGMERASMMMSKAEARLAPLMLTKLWGALDILGQTKSLTSESQVTSRSPIIALFHRDLNENSVVSGRAYLRMCLEAASLGFAGWPMAALTDHPATNVSLRERFGVPSDRRLIQAIRFGAPTGMAPPRARRPLNEVVR